MNAFRLLRPEEVMSDWPRLSALLSHAVDQCYGEVETDDIRKMVLAGLMFVFASDSFALTCEFKTYPKKTIMVVGFGAGKVSDRTHVLATLDNFAKVGGASSIRTYCKNPAMVRYYQRFFTDVSPIYTVLERPL